MDSTYEPTPAAPEISALRTLLRERKFAEMLLACEALLVATPHHREVLLFQAIAQRHLGRGADALKTLAVLEQNHPRFSRLYEERGRCCVDAKDAAAAISAFQAAVSINYALPGTWGMLESLYLMTRQPDDAAVAASHVATLRKIPREVVTAIGLFADGELEQAESLVRDYLLRNGNQVEAMRLLARIGIARKVFDDAELLLAAVLELAPTYHLARQEYAGVLIEQHKYEAARKELERLLAREPDSRDLSILYAASCVGFGEHERAIGIYRELLQGERPRMPTCTCRSHMR